MMNLKLHWKLKAVISKCIKEEEEAFGDVCPICGKPAKKVVYFAKAY